MKVTTETAGEVEILGSSWYTVRNPMATFSDSPVVCVGIITRKDKHGIIKTYIGVGDGIDEEQDTIQVLDTGVPYYEHKFCDNKEN